MARSHIPGLVDLLRVDDPQAIESLAGEDGFDRRFEPRGPRLNRFLLHRIRNVLSIGGHRLPAVAEREDAARAEAQAELEERLTALAATMAEDGTALDPLVARLRSRGGGAEIGPLVQEAVGRLFVPGFEASADLWDKARLLASAPGCLNPVKLVRWALTGEVETARKKLGEAVGDDPVAFHAIAIAVHNMVRGVEAMQVLWDNEAERRTLSTEAVVARCLFAPQAVLRQPSAPGRIGADDYGTHTLIVLELDKARARRPDRQIVFMTGCWSQCPAHAWVPAFYGALWNRLAKPETGDVG